MRRRTFVGGAFAGLAAAAFGGDPPDSQREYLVKPTPEKAGKQSAVAGKPGSSTSSTLSGKRKAGIPHGNPALTLDDLSTAWMPRSATTNLRKVITG